MSIFKYISFILFIALFQNAVIAQESGGPPKKDQTFKSKRKQYKEDKKKWKEERRNKRLEEKKIREHHKRIQTKEVRKRMKRSKQKAIRNNTHQREPFFQRVFKKKPKRRGGGQGKERPQNEQQK